MYASDHTFSSYRKLLDTGGYPKMSSYVFLTIWLQSIRLLATGENGLVKKLKQLLLTILIASTRFNE